MQRYLVVDTETAGLDPLEHSILSVAAVAWERRRIVDEVEVFVAEPRIVFQPEAMAVNRLDLDWVRKHGRNPEEAVAGLEKFVRQHFPEAGSGDKVPLVGHNLHFDVGFLKRLYRLAGADYEAVFSHRVIDTMSVLRFFILGGKLPPNVSGSSAAFAHFAVPTDEHTRHTALGDARATALLLDRLLDWLDQPEIIR